jgi:hypothetical protein
VLETNCAWMILCVVKFLSVLLKIERCFVYDYLLTAGCLSINVNCTVIVVETEYSKKRIDKEKETTSWCNKK